MEQEKLVVNLSKKITFAKGGEHKETASLIFFPPTMEVYNEALALSQLSMQALLDQQGKGQQTEQEGSIDQDFDGAVVRVILLSSTSVKFTDVVEAFKTLAVKVGTFDGSELITEDTFAKLTVDDMTNMVCDYLANFTFPSLLSGLEQEKEK